MPLAALRALVFLLNQPAPTINRRAWATIRSAGLANIQGVFNIANPFQYKVEFGTAPGGPWTPILTPIYDFNCGTWPFTYYYRSPDSHGWYNVADMGCLGKQYLTDWQTPNDRDKLYYLKLTVRNSALVEFESLVIPARVDNGDPQPKPPVIDLALQLPDGSRRPLGCSEEVERGEGNLVVIKLQAWDEKPQPH